VAALAVGVRCAQVGCLINGFCRRSALHPAKGAAAHPWNPLAGVPPLASPIRPKLRARLSVK